MGMQRDRGFLQRRDGKIHFDENNSALDLIFTKFATTAFSYNPSLIRFVLASLYEGLSVGRLVGRSVGRLVSYSVGGRSVSWSAGR